MQLAASLGSSVWSFIAAEKNAELQICRIRLVCYKDAATAPILLFCFDVRAVLVVAVRHCNTQLLSESPGVRAVPVGRLVFPSGNVESDN